MWTPHHHAPAVKVNLVIVHRGIGTVKVQHGKRTLEEARETLRQGDEPKGFGLGSSFREKPRAHRGRGVQKRDV